MRKNTPIILFLVINFLLLCCQCSNQGEFYTLPKFDPIEVNENMVFLGVESDDSLLNPRRSDKIYVIDTKSEKIIYVYKNLSFCELLYDYSFDKNIYFTTGSSLFKLNLKEGILQKFEVEYPVTAIALFDNKVWAAYGIGGKHFTYDPIKNKVEYIYLPGTFTGWWGCINNKYYLSVEQEFFNDRIYNYTDKKILPENVLGVKYLIYFFNGYILGENKGNYLAAYYESSSYEDDYTDFYYIESLEPSPQFTLITTFKREEVNDCVMLRGAYEKDNFVYLCYDEDLDFYISKRDKENNYSEVKNIVFDHFGISFVDIHFYPPYIWVGSYKGIYKINMDDLSYTRIIE